MGSGEGCFGCDFKTTDCHSWCLCLAWLEDDASKTCFHPSSSILQEILSSGRDEEVTSGVVGAIHRLGFHFPAFAIVSNADSSPASPERLKKVAIFPGLGPRTFDPKGSWHSAGGQVFLSRTGGSLKAFPQELPDPADKKKPTSRCGHRPQGAGCNMAEGNCQV